MIGKIIDILKRYWIIVLSGVALVLLLINSILFFPGYMSPDSIDSLSQAVDPSLLYDWHPPVFAIVWRILIAITGTPASMLVLQLSIEWLMLLLLSLYVYKRVGSKKLSLAILGLGLLPITLGMSGVIWKDVQMANILGLVVVLILFLKHISQKRWRIALLVVILLLIGWGFLLRYNVVFALIPLIYLTFRQYGGMFLRTRTLIISMAITLAGMAVTGPVINAAFNIKRANAISAIMLDDILHTRSVNELNESSLPLPLRDTLVSAHIICDENKVIVNGYIACTDRYGKEQISNVHFNDLKMYWISSIGNHPFRYFTYRVHSFTLFLFAPESRAYVWQDGIIVNDLGQKVQNKALGDAMRIYVVEFGYRHFSFLFEAWFWLVIASVFLWYGRRFRKIFIYTSMVSLSAMIYIVSYAPVVVAADYRYIYWPVIALLITSVVLLVENINQKLSKEL